MVSTSSSHLRLQLLLICGIVIHVLHLHLQLTKLLKQVLGRYVLTKAIAGEKVAEINFNEDRENQVNNKDLIIRTMTKQMADKLRTWRWRYYHKSTEGALHNHQSNLHSSNRVSLEVVSIAG